MGVTVHGKFRKAIAVMNKFYRIDGRKNLTRASERVCDALASETPVRTGETAAGWDFNIRYGDGGEQVSEIFNYAHREETQGRAMNVALLLHYGHGTGTGGYVPGTHYITRVVNGMHDDTIKEIKAVIDDVR